MTKLFLLAVFFPVFAHASGLVQLQANSLCVNDSDQSNFQRTIAALGTSTLLISTNRDDTQCGAEQALYSTSVVILSGTVVTNKICVGSDLVDYFVQTVAQLGDDQIIFSTSVASTGCAGTDSLVTVNAVALKPSTCETSASTSH